MLKNVMETVVNEKLDEFWSKMDTCKCSKCKSDVLAYALNQLPAKYVVTKDGELYSKLSLITKEYEFSITIALAKSIKLVNDNPKHIIDYI